MTVRVLNGFCQNVPGPPSNVGLEEQGPAAWEDKGLPHRSHRTKSGPSVPEVDSVIHDLRPPKGLVPSAFMSMY